MAIQFGCPCGKKLSVGEDRAGKRVRCPGCGQGIEVPAASPRFPASPRQWLEESVGGTLSFMVRRPPDDMPGFDELLSGPAADESRLARYEVAGSLGRGGMGEVLLVKDPEIGRELAAKVILPGRSDGRRALEKFLLEAQVTGQLEHPNIVPVHELGLAPDGRVYFTMKRVRGKDLAKVLDEQAAPGRRGRSSGVRRRAKGGPGRALGVERVGDDGAARVRLLEVFLKVLDAVAFAHSRGVIHRDLKPANVMVGEYGEVLVLDWGLARVVGCPDPAAEAVTPDFQAGEVARLVQAGQDSAEPLVTREGQVMGTLMYMPPEQAEGKIAEIDHRSDVYSLGAILYEILTLEHPLSGSNPHHLLAQVARGELVPPSARAPHRDVPRELEAAVLKAMAHEPARRYQDVASFRADIVAYLAGGQLAAARYSPWQLAAKWVRRHKALAIGTSAVLAALLAGAIGIRVAASRARAAAEEREIAARTRGAEESFARSGESWEAAERIPFNPAAPEAYFRGHLEPLFEMGRSLANHPAPPDGWAAGLVAHADELIAKAVRVSDWTLALVLARSVLTWGAASEAESQERAQDVTLAQAEAAREDVRRLDAILARIRTATTGEKQGALFPGEPGEQALRLARSTGPELTEHVIGLLVEGDASWTERHLLIELLGRKGDVHTRSRGISAPEFVTLALEETCRDPDPRDADFTSELLAAAVRLESRAPGSLPGIRELLEDARRAHEGRIPMVAAAAERAQADLSRATEEGPLPALATNAEEYRRRLDELADTCAATVRSKGEYTRTLLERAQAPLAPEEKAFVLGQLGLHGDQLPPDPGVPEFAAVPVLRTCFDAAWSDREHGALEPAIAAANALSRLGDGSFSVPLLQRRHESGQTSVFWNRTTLAQALTPIPTTEEPATARGLCARGRARFEQKDLDGAIEDFAAAIRLDPDLAEAYCGRGIVRNDQKDVAGAIGDYSAAIRLDPSLAEAYHNRGMARNDQKDVAGAIEDYTTAIRLAPDLIMAYCSRGAARRDQQDVAGAIEDFTAAIRLDPGFAFAYCGRGVARRDQKDLAGAIEDYSAAIRLDPNYAEAYSDRGSARRDQGDLAGAIEDFTTAIRLDPNRAAAYYNRGNVRDDQGDVAGAIEDYSAAIRLAPDYASAYYNRGIARHNQKDLAGAIEDYSSAIRLDPSDAWAYCNRGVARNDQTDFAGAVEDYSAAIRLDPGHWPAWTNRGAALARLGLRDEARESFRRALESCPPAKRAYVEGFRRQVLGE